MVLIYPISTRSEKSSACRLIMPLPCSSLSEKAFAIHGREQGNWRLNEVVFTDHFCIG